MGSGLQRSIWGQGGKGGVTGGTNLITLCDGIRVCMPYRRAHSSVPMSSNAHSTLRVLSTDAAKLDRPRRSISGREVGEQLTIRARNGVRSTWG